MKAASLLLLASTVALAGCTQETPSAPAAAPHGGQVAQQPGQPGQQPAAPLSKVGVARVIDRPKVQNDVRQLAQLYLNYDLTVGKVRSVEAFKNYIKRDARELARALDDGVYAIVPGARTDSNTVVAYEKNADAAGQHIVAMGDGSVRTMSSQQLQAALKGQ